MNQLYYNTLLPQPASHLRAILARGRPLKFTPTHVEYNHHLYISSAMERLELILPFLEVLDDVKSLPNPSWCGESTPLPSTVVDRTYQMIWYCYLHPEVSPL